MKKEIGVLNELAGDFGIKVPRVLVSGQFAVVDSVKKIYVLTEEIVTLETSDGYISVLGDGISVETLCDERIELKGRFSGVEFIRREKKTRKTKDGTKKARDGIGNRGTK